MQVIQSKTKLFNHILYIVLPIIALGILTGAFLLVAHENSIRSSFAVSDSEDYTVTLQDDTSISVGFVGDPLVLNLQPTAAGNFVSGNLAVEVATNSYYGYNLSMSATTTSLSGSVAVGSEKPTIPTLQSATSEADFPTNYWGFKRGADTNKPDANYQPMLANASIPLNLVSETDNFDPNSDISTITFGVKLDNRTPSGTYDITINFLAVANINTPYYMQNITDAELVSLMPSVNDTYTLTDSRDNKQYTVAKLKDGQYWMTTNLDLAGGTTLTPQDSNITTNYTLPESSKTGFDDNSKAFVYNSGSTDCSSADGCYSYYSWNAATAMSGTSITTANTDAPSSICPAGWHLPTSRRTNTFGMTSAYQSDFYTLAVDYGMNTGAWDGSGVEIGPDTKPNFEYAGIISNSNLTGQSSNSQYWASSYAYQDVSYALFISNSAATMSSNESTKKSGFPIRCIHNATMQNLTDTEVAAMNTNETKVLYDSRDNQRYTATKLLDGKLWMTKNLNLAGGTQLSSTDTDMPSGYTLPTANGFGANNTLPASVTATDLYAQRAFVYNSESNDCSSSTGCYSYYNWITATIGSAINALSNNADAQYSICPKGWKLPSSRSTVSLAQGKPGSDFYRLAVAYGMSSDVISNNSSVVKDNVGNNTIPNFQMSGYYQASGILNNNVYGYYWSGTSAGYNQSTSANAAYSFNFSQWDTNSSTANAPGLGGAVRCLYDSSMQNFTTTDASALAEYDELTLTDRRDGKTYYVAKLKDGNVWMTQNLDLDLSTSTTLTSADTDLNSVTSWTPVRSTIDSTNYGNITTCSSQGSAGTGCWGQTNTGFASGWTNDNDTPYSDNPGYRYMTFTNNTAANPAFYSNGDAFANCSTQDTNCGGQGHYMIGNYYNFAAANATNSVAGTVGHTVTNSDADFVMPNSICPKGWRMPLGQTNANDFTTLMTAYNIYGTNAMAFNYQGLNAVRRSPLYFVRSGNVHGGTLHNAGTNSLVWSSTISAEAYGHNLDFNGTGILPATSDNRFYGFAVRCLLRTE
ncbi:hypothetical protein IKG68_00305 [Candidatus Saccharibacteria bacterium]|nr:hypothetical protein [Candidatus Saccharibacteria bacterium]